jgi:hypothetical protein
MDFFLVPSAHSGADVCQPLHGFTNRPTERPTDGPHHHGLVNFLPPNFLFYGAVFNTLVSRHWPMLHH